MAIKSHISGQNRALDYVYDSTYTVPGLKDICQIHSRKMTKYAPTQILTNYDVMFADIPKICRQIIRQKYELLPNIKIQSGVKYNPFSNDYIHIDNKCDERYVKFTPDKRRTVNVKGKCRANFFYHPPNNSTSPITELYPQSYQPLQTINPQPKHRNVGIQTIYRESSAQTSPYLPNAIIADNDGKTSEIVQIANVIHSTEKPGDFEVKVIERLRKQRAWKKSLSKVLDPNEIDKKQIIFEAFEWEEWLAREEQIKNIQNIRFEMVKDMMEKREKTMKENSVAKLNNSMQRIEEEHRRYSTKLDQEYKRNLKKLEDKHKKLKEKIEKDNISREQNKFTFKTLKSKTKPRYKIEQNIIAVEKFPEEYLKEISKKLENEKFTECPMTRIDQLAKPKKAPNEIYKGFNSEKNLKQLYESLKVLGENGKNRTRKLKQKQRSEAKEINQNESKEIERIESNNSIQSEKFISSTYFQFDKNNDNMDEISQKMLVVEKKVDNHSSVLTSTEIEKEDDHRTTVEAKPSSSSITSMEIKKEIVHNVTIEENEYLDETNNIKSENDIPNSIFNFLDSELGKLQEERKVQALYILAERERIKREAAESGLRQKEDRRRREHDEIYRNLMKASHDTVTMFLENVLIEETDLKACIDAREIVQKLAKDIDEQAYQETKLGDTSVECTNTIISDIIDNFVFPEIEKRLSRKSMKEKQYRHFHAASTALHEQIETVFNRKGSGFVLDKLIEDVLSSEDLISGISVNKNVAYHEANTALREIIKNVLTHPHWKPSVVTITKSLHATPRTVSDVHIKKHSENFNNIVSEIITKLLEYVKDNDKEETISLETSFEGNEKLKNEISITTMPGLINLLEYKKMILAEKFTKLFNHSEEDMSDEDIIETTTGVNTYSFINLEDKVKSPEEQDNHSESDNTVIISKEINESDDAE